MDSVKESREKQKRFLIVADLALLLILIGVGIMLFQHDQQERILKYEIHQVMAKDFYTDEFLVDVQTNGHYGVVEREAKQYFKELSDVAKNINKLEEDDTFVHILTSDNFKEDGPDFVNSLQKITAIRENITNSIDYFTKICTKEYIDSLIEKQQLSVKDIKLYRDLIYQNNHFVRLEESKRDLVKVGDSFSLFLSDCEDILIFLRDHRGQWIIEEDSIIFRTTDLLAEYQRLSQKVLDDSNF